MSCDPWPHIFVSSNKYNKLQSSLPNEKLNLLDDYETLYEFKSLTDYPAKINSNDIDNPFLEVEKKGFFKRLFGG